MNNTETIIDPLGNEVVLPHSICDLHVLGVDSLEIYDKPSRVIEAPAMMMQVSGAFDENYYFRSVGWENSLLIGTKKINGIWTAHIVMTNPSSQQLRDIYKKGNHVNLIEYSSF